VWIVRILFQSWLFIGFRSVQLVLILNCTHKVWGCAGMEVAALQHKQKAWEKKEIARRVKVKCVCVCVCVYVCVHVCMWACVDSLCV